MATCNLLTLILVVCCAINVLGDIAFPEADVDDATKQNAEVR